jgi:hypothetical protein
MGRFERGKQNGTIRITFDFEFTTSPLPHGQRVEFHPPDEVRIQTHRVR